MDAFTVVLIALTAIVGVLFLPMNLGQIVLLAVNRRSERALRASTASDPPFPDRRVLVLVTTNGRATDVVEMILRTIHGYGLSGVILGVVREEKDRFGYPTADLRITVPAGYSTPNDSRHKMRAQHYASQQLPVLGYGPETYVVHLDDDSVPSREYLVHVFRMRSPSGQGCLRLRAHGKHLLSTLADMARVSNCDVYCSFFNGLGKPMEVHGEGLVIRADIEASLGWDFGTFGAEDLMMGQRIVAAGLGFERIPAHVSIAPPTTVHDFFVQRRRWMVSVLWAWKRIGAIRKAVLAWVVYRHSMSWLGVVGISLFAVNLLLLTPVPLWLDAVGIVNLVGFFAFYQYGAWTTDRHRYALKMAVLQFPVSVYECATFVYGMVNPPNRLGFETIRKV